MGPYLQLNISWDKKRAANFRRETSAHIKHITSKAISALYTVWLFTFSDWKAAIIPETLLALANAKCGHFAASDEIQSDKSWLDVFSRLPIAMFWVWLTILVQDVANQRLPGGIEEDLINKPWRPLPSKRISADAARTFLFYLIAIALSLSAYLGNVVLKTCAILMCMIWLYNDLNGSDAHPITRNALNAFGFVAYGVGATAITTAAESFSYEAKCWFGVIWLAIFTTSHGQDFADLEGDRVRGRATMPLLFGETISRLSLVVFVALWSVVALQYWTTTWASSSPYGLMLKILLIGSSASTAVIALTDKTMSGNKMLLKSWCLWVAALFSSPLLAVW